MSYFQDIYSNKSVLLTGFTGFKGSWLALWLVRLGAKVTGYSLDPPTMPNHLDRLNLDMTMITGDIRDEEKLTGILSESKPDIVFHLAAQPIVRYSYVNPKETFETNVIGTLNLLESCRKTAGVRAIINVTSDKCYENKEWIWPYRENEPMGGYDPYSASKGCAELLTSCYRNSFFNMADYPAKHSTLIASCRAGNVIGGGDWAPDRLVPDIIRAASEGRAVDIRNPLAVRPWQHVLEPLAGYLALGQKLLEDRMEFGEAWNFGPDEGDNREVGHVVELFRKYWDKVVYNKSRDMSGFHEAHLLKLDSSKAKTKLKWKPVWNFDKAVQKTAEWYKSYYEENSVISSNQLDSYLEDAKSNDIEWAVR